MVAEYLHVQEGREILCSRSDQGNQASQPSLVSDHLLASILQAIDLQEVEDLQATDLRVTVLQVEDLHMVDQATIHIMVMDIIITISTTIHTTDGADIGHGFGEVLLLSVLLSLRSRMMTVEISLWMANSTKSAKAFSSNLSIRGTTSNTKLSRSTKSNLFSQDTA
jgi:hypothetical protein